MGSSGGGNYSAPERQTPPGALDFGETSAPQGWSPSAMVLPTSGAPMTPEMMASQWQNPSFFAPSPTPVVNNASSPDLQAELAKLMAGQDYANAMNRASAESGGNTSINSFGTLASLFNPNLSSQQKSNIAHAGGSNRTSK